MGDASKVVILRRRQVEARCGLARSSLYARIKRGTWPPAIRVDRRSVGWIEAEIEEVLSAHVRGCSEEALKAIVAGIVSRRTLGAARTDAVDKASSKFSQQPGSPDRATTPRGHFRCRAEDQIALPFGG